MGQRNLAYFPRFRWLQPPPAKIALRVRSREKNARHRGWHAKAPAPPLQPRFCEARQTTKPDDLSHLCKRVRQTQQDTLDKDMPRWLNPANLLTLLRLILTPYVVGAILGGQYARALGLFFVAAVTDVMDGALARNYGQAQQVGAYLGPIADKFRLSGIFLALGATQSVPWWVVGIVFGRDIYILLAVIGILSLTKVRKFPPSRWGKISTFVQIAAAIACMTEKIFPGTVLGLISAAMLWVCVAFTVWSGVDYTIGGVRMLRSD